MPIFLFQPYYLMYMNNAYKRVTGSGNPNQPQLATGKSNSTCELSYNSLSSRKGMGTPSKTGQQMRPFQVRVSRKQQVTLHLPSPG